jgi:hypothetical protein
MKPPVNQPVFVPRGAYRQRRVRDAARMLPLLGLVLCLLPLLWQRGEPAAGAAVGAGAQLTSVAMIYLFAVWALLIALAAVLSRLIRPTPDEAARDNAGPR